MEYTWDIANKETYNNRYGRYKFEKEYQFIISQLGKPENILDVAGGSGRFAVPLNAHCSNITVVDINREALEIIKSRNKNIKTIEGNFIELPIEGKYDFILCIEALNYFDDYDILFRKIRSLMNEGSVFVFLTVNTNSWRFWARKFNRSRENYGELSMSEIGVNLKKNNLVINKITGFNWIPLPLSMSDNFLVRIFSFLEKILMLERWVSQSPWLLISVSAK